MRCIPPTRSRVHAPSNHLFYLLNRRFAGASRSSRVISSLLICRSYQAASAEASGSQVDPSRIFPPTDKRGTVPERNVLVLGDAMADWLAYGLEDAYAEQPEVGVIRKHKTVSGSHQISAQG